MSKDEALKLALEALDAWMPTWPNLIEKQKTAITAIKQALAASVQKGAIGAEYQKSPWDEKGISMPPPEAPVQEPVAWRYDLKQTGSFAGTSTEYSRIKLKIGENWTPLYTTPPAAQPAPTVQEPVAQAWAEGYRAGIDDERTSEANIGIAGMGMKVEPARNNPYHTTPPAAPSTEESSAIHPAVPDHSDELTIAYMSGVYRGKELAVDQAVPDAFGTREGEHPQYIQGWNDCRAEMLSMRKRVKP
jgi:hypothetical protein